MVIAAPGAKGNGRRAGAPVESVDIYPTLAALCGLKAPDYAWDGVSLVPILNDPDASVKDGAVSQLVNSGNFGYTPAHRAIVTRNGTTGRQGLQLYDMEEDPQEFHNLAADPACAGIVKEQAALLKKGCRRKPRRPEPAHPHAQAGQGQRGQGLVAHGLPCFTQTAF